MVVNIFRLYLPPFNEELCIKIGEIVHILKSKYFDFFFTYNNSLCAEISYLKFKTDLMGKMLTVQPS